MQERLDNNILMYSTDSEGKSVIAERFIKTLNAKIYKQMTGNDSKSYFGYLNNNLYQYVNVLLYINTTILIIIQLVKIKLMLIILL